ncbi:hypothetical protein [Alteromonas sp. ALT199]|nr:hypothetical protein [Alteromonas sp. ALT199]
MNKGVLLDLAHALSDAIEATENELHTYAISESIKKHLRDSGV